MYQNISHAKQHHLFDVERWCSCDMQRSRFVFPACLLYDSCHHNESRLCGSVKASIFAQIPQIDHKFIDNGMLCDEETQANLLVSLHVLHVIASHFARPVQNNTTESLRSRSIWQ